MSDLEAWFIARITAHTDLPHGVVDATTPVYRYGLDSRALAFLVDEAERTFARAADLDRISPAETIRALVDALPPADG